ncbi:MAG TPA: ankyrin repeat domain-containing protein [Candidatus Acidoferrales bacterium]|jgi:hypothetical protein|nr:ankyrin repeat domain-containing protein [Candidatus Acidoferrales bacterium]
MIFSPKDKIALLLAAVLGPSAAYLSSLAGYGWLVVAAPYAILVIPGVVVYVADQRKRLVSEVCILSYGLYVLVGNWRIGGLGKPEALKIILLFWAIGTVASSPAAIFFCLQKARARKSYRLELFFVGLLFLIVLSSLSLDAFVPAVFGMGWVICWFVESLWRWRRTPDHASRQFALVIGSVFLITSSTSILFILIFKQQAFAYAAKIGDSKVAVALVRIGADPNTLDSYGDSSLRAATWNGDSAMVKALLSMGAKVDLEAYPGERDGFAVISPSGTALAVAAAVGRTEICELLLSAGANPNKKNRAGSAPLLLALSSWSISCVPLLLDRRADANARDSLGRAPLMLLAAFDDSDPGV